MQTVHSFINEQKTFYETREVPLFDGLDYSMYDTLNRIDHYWANTYIEDAYDDIIGDYPFDNVSKFRVLLEARATDFDVKHIETEPTNGSREAKVSAMIVNKALKRHLQTIRFASFLNNVCITRPKYGGVLVKNVNGVPTVTPWQNVIVDVSNILGSPIIERKYYTPNELLQQKGWKNTKEAVRQAQEWREKDIKNGNGTKSQGYLIEVDEVVGIVPKSMLLTAQGLDYSDDDNYEFVYAQIIVCGSNWIDEDGLEHGITLYADTVAKPLFKYLARNPIAGRDLGEGVIESLFQHQKWHNFTKTEEMRMIAIAGKKIYVTDDPDVLSNIFDENVDHGTVLKVSEGKRITELNQIPTGTPIYQNMRTEWDDSASRTTSSFGAKIGEEAKAGTPFRAQYLQNVEASSQFEQYREEIGEDLIKPIIEEWVLPMALKEASKEDSLFETFSPQELQLIDDTIINQKIADEIIRKSLNREVVTQDGLIAIEQKTRSELAKSNKRELTDIKEFINNAHKRVVIHITDEARNKAVYFESLANALALLAPEDPRRNAIIDKIFDAIGISKEELELYAEQGVVGNSNPQLENKEATRQASPERAVLPVTA